MDRKWLKITFDQFLPGRAKVLRMGRKRPVVVPGQWVVFDKNDGVSGLKTYAHGVVPVVFASGDIQACHDFIEKERN